MRASTPICRSLNSKRSSAVSAAHPVEAPAANRSHVITVPLIRLCASLAFATNLLTPRDSPGAQEAPRPFVEKVAGTLVTFEMMPVPAGTVQRPGAAPLAVGPFWMMKTEVTWDLYDVYVFELDKTAESAQAARAADAVSRPSKPYVLPGDAFGHAGYPALGMSLQAAREFARWLSAKTGKRYRLPTIAEWQHACRATPRPGPGAAGLLATEAWFAGNADDKTHPVASRAADALGLHDMLGNVAEWAVAGADSGVVGGGFSTDSASVSCDAWQPQTSAWNVSDPQLPKSRWWLTDAFFVGMRLVAADS
jgi:formylglycine-generating enzyme required for sulfatase activity